MATKLDVEPGGEYLLPTARQRLRVLREEADRYGMLSATRWINVSSGETIYLQTTRYSGVQFDLIRIRAKGEKLGPPGFLVMAAIRTPEGMNYTSDIFIIPASLDKVADFKPQAGMVTYATFVDGGSNKTACYYFTPAFELFLGYLTGQKTFGNDNSASVLPFSIMKYAGVVYRVDLKGRVWKLDTPEEVFGSEDKFPDFDDSGGESSWAGFHSLGSRGISYSEHESAVTFDDVWMTNYIDFVTTGEGNVNVVYTMGEEVSSYGTDSWTGYEEVTQTEVIDTAEDETPRRTLTYNFNQDSTQTIPGITFPICKALRSDGSTVEFTATFSGEWTEVREDQVQKIYGPDSFVPTEWQLVSTTTSASYESASQSQVTFNLPGHGSYFIDLGSSAREQSASGGYTQSGVVDEDATASMTSSDAEGVVEVLYASASWDALIYGLFSQTQEFEQTGFRQDLSFGVGSEYQIVVEGTFTYTFTYNVVAIINGVQITLSSQTIDDSYDTEIELANGYLPTTPPYYYAYPGTEDYLGNDYFMPERVAEQAWDQGVQFGRLPAGAYLGSVGVSSLEGGDDLHAVFASKPDLAALKLAVVNRVMNYNVGPLPEPITDVSGYDWWFVEIRIV